MGGGEDGTASKTHRTLRTVTKEGLSHGQSADVPPVVPVAGLPPQFSAFRASALQHVRLAQVQVHGPTETEAPANRNQHSFPNQESDAYSQSPSTGSSVASLRMKMRVGALTWGA